MFDYGRISGRGSPPCTQAAFLPRDCRKTLMPFVGSFLALLIGVGAAQAQAPHIDRLDITDFGTYKVERGTAIRNEQGLKTATVARDPERLEFRTIIPAQIGTTFGVRYKVIGTPEDADVTIRKIISFPPPGLQPSRGKFVLRDESVENTRIGETVGALYTLEDSFELVPGIWTFELWDGDRKLLTRSFTLEKVGKQ
jgi:Domain of unknown function (DUF3859)